MVAGSQQMRGNSLSLKLDVPPYRAGFAKFLLFLLVDLASYFIPDVAPSGHRLQFLRLMFALPTVNSQKSLTPEVSHTSYVITLTSCASHVARLWVRDESTSRTIAISHHFCNINATLAIK